MGETASEGVWALLMSPTSNRKKLFCGEFFILTEGLTIYCRWSATMLLPEGKDSTGCPRVRVGGIYSFISDVSYKECSGLK